MAELAITFLKNVPAYCNPIRIFDIIVELEGLAAQPSVEDVRCQIKKKHRENTAKENTYDYDRRRKNHQSHKRPRTRQSPSFRAYS